MLRALLVAALATLCAGQQSCCFQKEPPACYIRYSVDGTFGGEKLLNPQGT